MGAAEVNKSTGTFHAVADLADVPEGAAIVFAVRDLPGYGPDLEHLEELSIAFARAGEVVYAIENRCSHDNGPLGNGPIEGTQITCTRHGARFELSSGKPTRMPAISPVMVFPTRVVGGRIEVDLSRA